MALALAGRHHERRAVRRASERRDEQRARRAPGGGGLQGGNAVAGGREHFWERAPGGSERFRSRRGGHELAIRQLTHRYHRLTAPSTTRATNPSARALGQVE